MKTPVQPKLRLRDRRRRLLWVKVAAGTSVVLVSLVLVWFVARLPSLTISSVTVTGASVTSADDVKNTVLETMSGTYFYVVPKSNSLTLSAATIKKTLLEKFATINDVRITRDGFQSITLELSERKAVALWCDTDCYVMDENGFIFNTAGISHDFVTYYGVNGKTLSIGGTYLDGAFPTLMNAVSNVAKKAGHTVSKVVVTSTSDVEITFTDGGVLKFVMNDYIDDTLDNVASVFASQRFKNGEKFEYADFRFGDKVYVKFVGE